MRAGFTVPLSGDRSLSLGERTLVVGVLNVTPDSFFDGGRTFDASVAIERGIEMQAQGADIIEIGAESTRPGAAPLSENDELTRLVPILRTLGRRLKVPISVDTYKSGVVKAAIGLGAAIINDVSALRFDPALAQAVSDSSAALVLMHMRGTPATMQKLPPSLDILSEIERDLGTAVTVAEIHGVSRTRIILDPGIGFGKTLEQNLSILNRLDRLARIGFPVMIGTSRKSFIGRLTDKPASERLLGTAASVVMAISNGAHLVRVHDVREMVEVARVADAILNERVIRPESVKT